MKKGITKKKITSIKDIPISNIRDGVEILIKRLLKGCYTRLMFKITYLDEEFLDVVVLGQIIDEFNLENYSSWKLKYKVNLGDWIESEIQDLTSLVTSILTIHSMDTTTADCDENTINLYIHAKPYHVS